ncbi:MAG: hypothetical protein GY787_17895 [Alteromonadales bacterium]|nr:hypothetical protein [Alteromonadales bacterium]
MIIHIKVEHENEQGETVSTSFTDDELTSATSKALMFLKEQQEKEGVF